MLCAPSIARYRLLAFLARTGSTTRQCENLSLVLRRVKVPCAPRRWSRSGAAVLYCTHQNREVRSGSVRLTANVHIAQPPFVLSLPFVSATAQSLATRSPVYNFLRSVVSFTIVPYSYCTCLAKLRPRSHINQNRLRAMSPCVYPLARGVQTRPAGPS